MRRTRIEHILSALPPLATEERTFGIGSSVPGAAVSSRSKTVALFDHLVSAVAKAGRPADAHKRLIRVWNCKFIHSPWLVLWSASSRAEVLQRSSQTIDIFKIKIESERISTWDEPAFLRLRQVDMPACTV